MHTHPPNVQALIAAHLDLVAVLQNIQDDIDGYVQSHGQTVDPARETLYFLLNNVRVVIAPITHFLRCVVPILQDTDALSQFQAFLRIWIQTETRPFRLLAPYFAGGYLIDFERATTSARSPLYEATMDVLRWYGYLSASSSGQSSLASKYHGMLDWLIVNKYEVPLADMGPIYAAIFNEHVFAGLEVTARRVSYLLTVSERNVDDQAVQWWCDQFDSLHTEYQSILFSHYIATAPFAGGGMVRSRLESIRDSQTIHTMYCEEARQRLLLFPESDDKTTS